MKNRETGIIMRKLCQKRGVLRFFVLVLLLAVLPLQTVKAQQRKEKEIKVGYIAHDHMIKVDAEGNFYGYGVAYLNELAKQTGWTYKFIKVEENDRMEKLISGEIDLLCSIHSECKEKDELLFCQETTGLEYGMLATLKDNNEIFFDDFEHIQGKRIGINVNSDLENAFVKYARENGFSYEPVYFQNLYDMQMALSNRIIDIMLVSSLRDLDNIKYVGKTDSIEEFFTTSKNNAQLMEELNKADLKLKREKPFYISALHQIYYGEPYARLTGITRDEYEFISKNEPLRVVCDADSYPLEYIDEKTGKYKGIYADALQLISEESGLQFEYIPLEDYQKAWDMIKNGEADLIAGNYGNSNIGRKYNMVYTENYLTVEYTMVGQRNKSIPEKAVIALPKNYVGVQGYFQMEEPEWEMVLYDDVVSCFEAVEAGKADLTAVNSIFLQTVYNLNSYDGLQILPNMTRTIPISTGIAVANENSAVLKSIIDKTIHQIPDEKFRKCITENAINISYTPTLKESIQVVIPYVAVAGFLIILTVVFIIRKREKHYRYLALTDSVTGLWNDVKFYQEAQAVLDRNSDKSYFVITIDINNFKFINNDFGSRAGDRILQVLGNRIHEVFGGIAYYARGTADVFLVLIEEKDYRSEMLNPLKKEIYFDNGGKRQYYKIVIKAGIRKVSPGGKRKDIKLCVDQASLARKTVKDKADEIVAYYNEEMKENIARDLAIENKMVPALQNGEFQVYLQPKYHLKTEEIIGAEALVRWIDKEGKMIFPDKFIPLFERNGFIVKVDFYVYEQVMKKMAAWRKEGRKDICVSVNVSRVHIGTYDFFIKLNALIEKYKIPKECFELELTETVIGGNQNITRDFIRECKQEGYNVSIDDFGSGYSSLNLLKELPVDILKIDREFLNETTQSQRSSIIIQKIVEMAKKMKIGTLCEGVETIQQAEFLKNIGCDMAQGYLFSKPIPMSEFEKMI